MRLLRNKTNCKVVSFHIHYFFPPVVLWHSYNDLFFKMSTTVLFFFPLPVSCIKT